MPESSKPTSIQLMIRLLGLECRTARSSIYSEKAEIKSPRELLLPGSADIPACMGPCRKKNALAKRSSRDASAPRAPFDIASFRPLEFSFATQCADAS